MDLLFHRIHCCRWEHSKCSTMYNGQLPTRVIDVGLDGQSPRLYISQRERGDYLALSYRWGNQDSSHKRLLTLKENLAAHCQNIPLDQFPKTFREAIEVSRNLEIRYLWIDSVCIVQDDEADWETEANRMASVYSEAVATIFADRAAHCDDGLFPTTEEKTLSSVRVLKRKPAKLSRVDKLYVQLQVDEGVAESTENFYDLFYPANQGVSPLAERAWALQEEYLSRRSIYFTSTEIEWKCAEFTACSGDLGTYYPKMNQDKPSKKLAPLWEGLVEDFTSRKLTYETDRLIAIAGIAAKMSAPPKDYLGGLWRSQLNTNILWKPAGSAAQRSRPAQFIAPSWSWAAVSSPIQFISTAKSTEFIWEIIDAECCVKDPDFEFGRVVSGYLQVKSKIADVKVEERPRNMSVDVAKECSSDDDAIWRTKGADDQYLTIVPVNEVSWLPTPFSTALELDVQSDWDDLISKNGPELCLLCIALDYTPWGGDAERSAMCLLLKRSCSEKNQWERVCYVSLEGMWKSWEPYTSEKEVTIV